MNTANVLRHRSWLTLFLLFSMIALPLIRPTSAGAQGPVETTDVDAPPPVETIQTGVSGQAVSHYGSSPFTPPEDNDTTFVVDRSAGLDTGCTFRGGGPLMIDLKVDRYPGDIQKLLANGIAGANAVLRLPAYDVDYYGSSPPERDRISFNGNVVPTEYLTGDNNVWKLNAFNIPLEWIKFPADPGENGSITPASNTIRIDIDTLSSSERWCTSIDWAALSIEVPRPVLMAHGILSSGTTWSFWTSKLAGIGLPNATLNMGNLDSIQNNAGKIKARADGLIKRWGVDKLNIVAHSKGGLDSRDYIERNNTIDTLIQLGTPNAGSPLADAIQAGVISVVGLVGSAVINQIAGPAGWQLTTPYMAAYNAMHGSNPNTDYISLAGDYRFGGWGIKDTALAIFYGGRSDLIVPVWSVHALSYASHLTYRSDGSNKQAQHTEMQKSQDIYNQVYGTVTARAGATGQTAGATSAAASAGLPGSASTNAPVATSPVAGSLPAGTTITETIPVDSAGAVTFMLFEGDTQLGLKLTSPSGTVFDPSSTPASSEVEFERIDGEGLRYQIVALNNAEVGNWKVAVSSPAGAAEAPYVLTGLIGNSTIQLQATTDRAAYAKGETVTVQATLQGTTAATSEAKVVTPDGSSQVISLASNGAGGFSGSFTATQAGLHRILVTAQGSTPAFTRSALVFAPVSASTTKFSGSWTGGGADTNGDGLFDNLTVNAGVNVSADGSYRLLGVLVDKNGVEIATATTITALTAGTRTVALKFDGERIYKHDVDGPYTLKVARLAEEGETALPLDEVKGAYTSPAYTAGQFQHAGIAFPGSGSDRGIDTNANGLFDQLELKVDVDVTKNGYYNWSGHLVDRNGTELGFISGSSYLNVGRNTLSMRFDGWAIGRNGVDGPYALKDVLIYSGSNSAAIFHAYTTTAYTVGQFEGAPPVSTQLKTTATSAPAPNAAGWNNSNVVVTLQATGGTSGVKQITYSATGAQTIPVATVAGDTAVVPTITAEGTTTLTFYATDNAGNVEASKTYTVKLDKTAPVVDYSGNAGSYTVDQMVEITCSATDTNGSGIASTTCKSLSAPAYTLPLGVTTLSAMAEDVAGNQGSGSTSFTVEVTYGSLCNLTGQFLSDTKPQLTTSFCAKLNAAEAAAGRGDTTAQAGALDAFKNELSAQSGKALTSDEVRILANLADQL